MDTTAYIKLVEEVEGRAAKSIGGYATYASSDVPNLASAIRELVAERESWRCFHCDEVFATKELAAEHFGDGDYEDEPPVCIEAATTEKRELVKTNRRLWKEAQKAEADIDELADERNRLAEELAQVKARVAELEEQWNTRSSVLCGNCGRRYRGPLDEGQHGLGICGVQLEQRLEGK